MAPAGPKDPLKLLKPTGLPSPGKRKTGPGPLTKLKPTGMPAPPQRKPPAIPIPRRSPRAY